MMKFRRKLSLKTMFLAMALMLILYVTNQIKILQKVSYNILHFRHHSLVDTATETGYQSLVREPINRRLAWSRITNILFENQGNFSFPALESYLQTQPPLHSEYSSFPLFPFETDKEDDDRIWNQMRYIPHNEQSVGSSYKHILLYYGQHDVSNSSFAFCPTKKCFVSGDLESATTADVILWMHGLSVPDHQRPIGQIWALYLLESPFHTSKFPDFERLGANYSINWTATYRQESTIVTPYFKYTPFDLTEQSSSRKREAKKNYAYGKTKMAAWFVSNCGSFNQRFEYVKKLQKYIQVDIYGQCGTLECPRSDYKGCFQILNKQYKFYLAFENSNCRNYITEKFFLNGLSNDVVPIVMGAPPEDYRRVAPPHSFIHVEDFEDVEGLVAHLNYLNSNDTAYNEYLAWKGSGLVDTNSHFWCRLCMMAHEGDNVRSTFPNVYNWWFNNETCTKNTFWKRSNKSLGF